MKLCVPPSDAAALKCLVAAHAGKVPVERVAAGKDEVSLGTRKLFRGFAFRRKKKKKKKANRFRRRLHCASFLGLTDARPSLSPPPFYSSNLACSIRASPLRSRLA